MKIKDIKGIVEKLPSTGNGFTLGAKQDVLNTDIDASECCEVDVLAINSILERHTDLLTTCIRTRGEVLMLASKAIAKANCVKWRTK